MTNSEQFVILPKNVHLNKLSNKQFMIAFKATKATSFKDHPIVV